MELDMQINVMALYSKIKEACMKYLFSTRILHEPWCPNQ